MTARLAPDTALRPAVTNATTAFSLRGPLIAAAWYLVLAVVLTWPLGPHLLDHTIGIDVDEGIFVWNLWWFRFSIFSLGQSPFHTDFIFYPVGVSLVYYTLTLVNGVLSLPLQPFIGPIGATNVILLLSLTGNGLAAFLLCRYILETEGIRRPSLPAFLGGALFAFAASRWVYASFGSSNLTSLWPLPLFVLSLLRTLDRWDAKRTAWVQLSLVVLWFALLFYTELTVAAFGWFLAVPLILVRIWRNFRTGQPFRLLIPLSAIFAGCLAVAAPLLALMWREDRIEGSYLTDKWGYADGFSADLLSFFLPTHLHPIFGTIAAPWTSQFTDVPIVYLGYGALVLAAIALWRFRAARFWGWLALGFAVLCLGPVLHILGRSRWSFDGLETNVPLPYIGLHYLPLIGANRFPNRFSIPLTLALAVLTAFGAAAILRGMLRRTEPVVAGLLLVVLLFDQIAVPLPLNDLRPPEIYQIVAAEPGDFSIAQLPLGWRNSYGMLGQERTTIQSYQAAHGKRTIGGNISRNPPFKFVYFSDLPVFGTIARLEQGERPDPATEAADLAAAPALIALYDLRYLAVHRRYGVDDAEAYARRVLPLDLVRDDGETALYRVRAAPSPPSIAIAFGERSSRPYRGDGWTGEEVYEGRLIRWSTRQSARVFLPNPGGRPSTIPLSVRAAPFDYPGRPEGRLRLRLNGQLVTDVPLRAGFAEYRAETYAEQWRDGVNHLDIEVSPVRPADVLPIDRSIGTTGVRSPVDLRVESAGLAAGNRAHILVDGHQVARDRRGYNLVAVDPANGRVLLSQAYDTFADDGASARLAAAIGGLPKGTIVLLAVKDDASAKLGEDAVGALRLAGIGVDLRGAFRTAHAAVGVVGAPAGTALEARTEDLAQIAIGRSTDERTLGVAVERVAVNS
ncbi:MAG: interleukin-like EMT inducer domain-containing protein [Dehalococcoidia bacterium]